METNINSIPGYRVHDYLLVLTPHEELRNRISRVKKEFAEQFATGARTGVGPQLVLAAFSQYAMMEDRLLNRLMTVAMSFPPFKVELKDFGSFPSHTIFINVATKTAVQQLVRSIRSEAQRLMKLDELNKPLFMTEPHITIGRKLLPWQYEKGWLEYSHKHFSGRFIADEMSLLRRAEGENKFSLVQRLQFQNLPVMTKQGELF